MGFIFLSFLGALGLMTKHGYSNGSPNQVLAPIDASNKICGYSEGAQDYPYLYIYNIEGALKNSLKLFSYSTCIQSCPTDLSSTLKCFNQSECNKIQSKQYSDYTTYELFGYCVPNEETLHKSIKA